MPQTEAAPLNLAQCTQAILTRALRLACEDVRSDEPLRAVVRRYVERATDELLVEAFAEHSAG